MAVSDNAVKAAQKAYRECEGDSTESHRAALTAALPFLPVQGAVKKLEWNEYNDEQGIPDRWDAEASSFGVFYSIEIQHDGYRVVFDHEAVGAVGVFDTLEAAKAAAQADYSARILSALEPSAARFPCDPTDEMVDAALDVDWENEDERATVINIWHAMTAKLPTLQPSAARELALEEVTLERSIERWRDMKPPEVMKGSTAQITYALEDARKDILSLARTLSSPDHADAVKVEGDGWLPIETAPKDGTEIWCWHKVAGPAQTRFYDGEWCCVDWNEDQYIACTWEPSHWRPLPSAPSEGAE